MELEHTLELYNVRKLKTARTLVQSAGSTEIAKLIGEEIERRTQSVTQRCAGALGIQEFEIASALTPKEEAFFKLVSERPGVLCSYEWLLRRMKAERHVKLTANELHLQGIARCMSKKIARYGILAVWYKRGYTWYPKKVEDETGVVTSASAT